MPGRRAPSPAPQLPSTGWDLTETTARLRRLARGGDDQPAGPLPVAQVEILQRLHHDPGLRITELASRQRLAANTVSGLVQQLVVAGLVVRRADPTDRRAVTVEITRRGHDQLETWLATIAGRMDGALAQLPPADQRKIVAALPALARLAERLEAAD